MTAEQPSMGLTRLPWDTEFFGHGIARLDAQALTPEQCAAVRQQCAAQGIECVYCLIDPADDQTIYTAEAEGFDLVDVRLTLALARNAVGAGQRSPMAASIRAATPADLAELKSIAGVSHQDTRFYHDARFTREQCAALYETWIEKSLAGLAEQVLVADWQGQVGGYVTCAVDEAQAGVIGLAAVRPGLRNLGLGHALLEAGLAWFRAHDIAAVSVVTQARNIAAQRLYQRSGFMIQQVGLWYHWWITP